MKKLLLSLLITGLSISWAFAQTAAIPANTTQTPVPAVETNKPNKVETKKKEMKKEKKEKKDKKKKKVIKN